MFLCVLRISQPRLAEIQIFYSHFKSHVQQNNIRHWIFYISGSPQLICYCAADCLNISPLLILNLFGGWNFKMLLLVSSGTYFKSYLGCLPDSFGQGSKTDLETKHLWYNAWILLPALTWSTLNLDWFQWNVSHMRIKLDVVEVWDWDVTACFLFSKSCDPGWGRNEGGLNLTPC